VNNCVLSQRNTTGLLWIGRLCSELLERVKLLSIGEQLCSEPAEHNWIVVERQTVLLEGVKLSSIGERLCSELVDRDVASEKRPGYVPMFFSIGTPLARVRLLLIRKQLCFTPLEWVNDRQKMSVLQ
jgi:hypothetical protein